MVMTHLRMEECTAIGVRDKKSGERHVVTKSPEIEACRESSPPDRGPLSQARK